MKTLYLVRHCKAEGQEPDAPLTPEGVIQSHQLVYLLVGAGLDRIVSSPYTRACRSIAPLAERLNLPVELDDRLAERVLCSVPLPDWQTHLAASFSDLDACLKGGESSRTAMQRAVAAATGAQNSAAQTTALVTHGNLMALLLKHFDDRWDFEAWRALSNPDVYRVALSHPPHIERIQPFRVL